MREFLDRFVGNISPSALLVSTFFWSWFDLVPFSPLLFTSAGQPADPMPLVVSLLISSAVLAAFFCSKRLLATSLNAGRLALGSLVFGSMGTVLVHLGARQGLAALSVAGGVLAGAFQGIGIVVVGCLIVCQGKTNALIHIAACLPFNIVFVLLGMYLQPEAAVVLCAVLPLLSALSYKVFLERGDNARAIGSALDAPRGSGRPRRAPEARRGDGAQSDNNQTGTRPDTKEALTKVGCIALLLIVTTTFGLVNFYVIFSGDGALPGGGFDYSPLIIRAVAATLIIFEYVFRSRQPYPLLVFALVLMASGQFTIGLVTSPSVTAILVGSALIQAGYATFDLLIWAIIVIMHRGSSMPVGRFLCFVYAFDQLGIATGTLLGSMGATNALPISVYTLLGLTMGVLAFVLLGNRTPILKNLHGVVIEEADDAPDPAARRSAPDNKVSPLDPLAPAEGAAPCGPAVTSDASHAPQQPHGPQQLDGVNAIASRFFLTRREADILALLVSGRSAPYIAEQLSVSPNTVKTHIRHIYAKLDIHDRQELLDLLG